VEFALGQIFTDRIERPERYQDLAASGFLGGFEHHGGTVNAIFSGEICAAKMVAAFLFS
jgi:hypothetical protein